MDFLKELREKVYSKWSGGKALYMSDDWKFGREAGIKAIIEVLKEMMVGEPIKGNLRHITNAPDDPHTFLENDGIRDPAYGEALYEGYQGASDEEVVVLVLRHNKQKEEQND